MTIFRNQLLLSVGGDTLATYGTLTRRYQYPPLGGEAFKETFTRAGTATYFGPTATGSLLGLTAAANVPRVEWFTDPVSGLLQPYLKLELGATNSTLQSQAWATTWTNNMGTGGSVTNNNAAAPDGTTTATLLVPGTNSSAAHNVTQAITITAGEYVAVSCFLKASGYPAAQFSAEGASGFMVWAVDLVNNLISLAASSVYTESGHFIVPLTSGWNWCGGWGKTATDTSVNQKVYGFDTYAHAQSSTAFAGAGGTTGILGWGAQLARNGTTTPLPPTSYIATTTGTVTRAADAFTMPFYVGPQPLWVYLRFMERGTSTLAAFTRIFDIGGGGTPVVFVNRYTSALYYAGMNNGSAETDSILAAGPSYGQVVELLYLLRSGGSSELRQSLNGAADTTGGQSANLAFPAAWGRLAIGLNNASDGGSPGAMLCSRMLVGLGAGTAVNTIADARAVPV